mgnify:CR=1 FL=1
MEEGGSDGFAVDGGSRPQILKVEWEKYIHRVEAGGRCEKEA